VTDERHDEGDREEPIGPPDEREEKGLGLTEEFARLEEEIRREVGGEQSRSGESAGGPADGERAADEQEADQQPASEEQPASEDAGRDDDAPAAGEWTAPEAAAPGPTGGGGETEEWSVEDGAGEEPAADAETEEPATEEPPDAEEPSAATDVPLGAEEPPDDSATEHTVVRHGPPVPVAAGVHEEPGEAPEIKTPALWWRFLMASVLIVVSVATAVSVSSLLLLTDVAAKLQPIPGLKDKLEEIGPGDPQTILIVGSDKRTNIKGDSGRSDTTMLLRVDPEKDVLSLFSLPRDLKVDIPGYGVGKLNEAYSYGGVKKTLETVQDLTGLEINHVVNVDFNGFAEAVDAIGCVYVDVDRHYFNDNSTALSSLDTYAQINVNAGYQRLCGLNALDYVRYRHTDTDIVRAARQQDFLRNARQQVPVSEVLPIVGGDTGSKLIDIFTKYTSSDINDPAQMIGALKAFLSVKDVPINQISFDGTLGPSYVTATPEQIHKAVVEFLNGKDTPGPTGGKDATKRRKGGGSGSSGKGKSKPKNPTDGANVIPTSDVLDPNTGINKFDAFGKTSSRRLNFPIWVPTAVVPGSQYSPDSRQYDIKDEDDKKQPAYKLVIEYSAPDRLPEYYGVQGTTWSDPPILRDSHDTETIGGRDYGIYYDGDRIRMVAWHDKDDNSYWVSNTLVQTLDNADMLAIATSMKEVK
jgi:polyisoprenyl-teichoic acid--peptidoglycan teichoic acid transferase